ncbi:MAG: hypothetical protein AAGA06_00630 [Pseudomonadota bacterium]
MSPDLFERLVAEAALAPSVHNTQPARWRLENDGVLLFEDLSCRLAAADAEGHDAAISMGAALEGMVLAAGSAGLVTNITRDHTRHDGLQAHARLTFSEGKVTDPLANAVHERRSWRGAFVPPRDTDRSASQTLAGDDRIILAAPGKVAEIAKLCDQASLGFMMQTPFRNELLSWMRLSPSHRRWGVDGLNADALHLNRIERFFAGVLLGPAFGVVRRLGLAPIVLSEASKSRSATAILVFHRPEHEDLLDTGRAFYRAWLHCEALGFGAAVLAALADDPNASETLGKMAGVPNGRRIVSVFRIGRRPAHDPVPRARQRVADLIV